MQEAQKGCPARPQRVKARGVPSWYVEGLNDARTLHGNRRVSARQGWEGEKGDFFSDLLIVRWFEVARWAVLPGDRRLFGLFDEATQIHFRCTEQLRFAALHDSRQQDVQRTIHS